MNCHWTPASTGYAIVGASGILAYTQNNAAAKQIVVTLNQLHEAIAIADGMIETLRPIMPRGSRATTRWACGKIVDRVEELESLAANQTATIQTPKKALEELAEINFNLAYTAKVGPNSNFVLAADL